MTSTDKSLTSNNLKTVDSVVKNMAVGNKETEQKVAFVATVVDQKTTVIEQQTESKVEAPLLIDEDEDAKYFDDEDEEFCAEIENFVASQNELDERAKAVKMAELTAEADKEATDMQKEVNVKEQVIDFEEEIDIKEPLDQEEITEEREKEKDENVDNEKKSDENKEEEVVKNLAESTPTTTNTDAAATAAAADPEATDAEPAESAEPADAGAGTDAGAENEGNGDMHEDVSPTLATAVKESPSTAPSTSSLQTKKRGRQSSKNSDKEKTSGKQKKSAKSSQKKKVPTKTEPTDAEIVGEEQEEVEYEIEKIVGHRLYKVRPNYKLHHVWQLINPESSIALQGKVVKYEIKWKGYDEKDNTMEAANRMHE